MPVKKTIEEQDVARCKALRSRDQLITDLVDVIYDLIDNPNDQKMINRAMALIKEETI